MWTDSLLGAKRLVSEVTKKRVAYSQAWRCKTCETLLPPSFQVDHVMPLAVGGSNLPGNLAALCPNCHAEKTQNEDARVRAYREAVRDCSNSSSAPCWFCGAIYSTYFTHKCVKKMQSGNYPTTKIRQEEGADDYNYGLS